MLIHPHSGGLACRPYDEGDTGVYVHMTGAEWFRQRQGGLNRYFESLFLSLQDVPDVDVSASAFGCPPQGGSTWGQPSAALPSRVWASWRDPAVQGADVVDRHFALYGKAPGPGRGKLVVHFQGPWAAESSAAGAGSLNRQAKLVLEKRRYRRADRFVVLSERFKILLSEDYGVESSRITVCPPGVDLSKFTSAAESGGPPTVLCVRRLERRMGIDLLLASWSGVLDAHPDARLKIVGRGSDEVRLRGLADEPALRASVEFVGAVSDATLRDLYAESMLTVVPSVALEGFGLITLESLASGRAPVVTDCGGLPDAVRGLDNSLIVPVRDVAGLSDRLVRALSGARPSPEECRRHAETFSWPVVARRHADLYRDLLR